MYYRALEMRLFRFFACICACALLVACKRPDPIRLQPTIEESALPESFIEVSDSAHATQLISGFFELSDNSWRWTAPRFAVSVGVPPAMRATGAILTLDFNLPEPVINALKRISIVAKVGEYQTAPEFYNTEGRHEYRRAIPASALTSDLMNISFNVDKSFRPERDGRNLALVVLAAGLKPNTGAQ
jgi:hypothetical protein